MSKEQRTKRKLWLLRKFKNIVLIPSLFTCLLALVVCWLFYGDDWIYEFLKASVGGFVIWSLICIGNIYDSWKDL